MEKKYNLIYQLRLETYVKVGNDMVPISFTGGRITRGVTKKGYYITADPKIQAALEADNAYGKQWILDKESAEREKKSAKKEIVVTQPVTTEPQVVTPEPLTDSLTEPLTDSLTESGTTEEPVSETQVTEETKPEAEPITESDTTTEPTAEPTPEAPTVDPEIAECTNYTLAKNYILKLYPETKRPDIISEEKLRDFAKTKGITFPEFAK